MKLLFVLQILWSNFLLSPSNFKGQATKENDISFSTTVLTVIPTVKEDKIYFDVVALFIEDSSFLNVDSEYVSRVLEHEQQHFNITELHARKLRQLIESYQGTSDKKDIERVHRLFMIVGKEWEITQQIYDNQTNHSIKRQDQILWNQTIKQQLKETEHFEQKAYNQRVMEFTFKTNSQLEKAKTDKYDEVFNIVRMTVKYRFSTVDFPVLSKEQLQKELDRVLADKRTEEFKIYPSTHALDHEI